MDIDFYSVVKAYLSSFGAKLAQTGEKGCRKKTNNKWYEIQDNTAYYAEFEQPKIIWAEIAKGSCFHYDTNFYYISNTAYMMSGGDLIYLLGVLNSRVFDFYFNLISTNLSGKVNRGIKTFIEQFPIPNFQESQTSQMLIENVERILKLVELPSDTNEHMAKIQEYSREIDHLVYQLYDLTTDEIAIIETNGLE